MSRDSGPLLLDVDTVAGELVQELESLGLQMGEAKKKAVAMKMARQYGFAVWEAKWTVKKYSKANDESEIEGMEPDEVIEKPFNLLMYGGASCLWQCLIGNGTGTADQTLTYFNNARAAIGVGDSTTSPAATQTNLQASTNKLRVAMSATYPQHTDATTSGAATIVFQGSFSTGQANFAWNEVGVFNSTTDAVGRMLNRLAPAGGFGTKASGTWVLQLSIVLS